MTDEKAKPPGSLLTDATAVHPRWYGPTPPAFPAQLRAEDEERDIQRRLEKARRVEEWEQTPHARHLGWNIFSPDWPRVVEHDALSLCSLVALSVGLTPYFASEAWVFNVALPHFKSEHAPDGDADPPEFVHDKEKRSDAACRLDTFIRRLSVALSGCSAGTLRVCDNGPAGPIVLRAEFVRFAEGKRWSLPAELAASAAPLSTEYAVPAAPETPPAPADPATFSTTREPTVQKVIAPYIAEVMRARPGFKAKELHAHMRREAGKPGVPFSKTSSGELLCSELGRTFGDSTVVKALTIYNAERKKKG